MADESTSQVQHKQSPKAVKANGHMSNPLWKRCKETIKAITLSRRRWLQQSQDIRTCHIILNQIGPPTSLDGNSLFNLRHLGPVPLKDARLFLHFAFLFIDRPRRFGNLFVYINTTSVNIWCFNFQEEVFFLLVRCSLLEPEIPSLHIHTQGWRKVRALGPPQNNLSATLSNWIELIAQSPIFSV